MLRALGEQWVPENVAGYHLSGGQCLGNLNKHAGSALVIDLEITVSKYSKMYE